MRIGNICTRNVLTVMPEINAAQAAKLMRDGHVGNLVVVLEKEEGQIKPVGIVTDRDIVTLVVAEGVIPDSIKVSDIMATYPMTAKDTDDIRDTINRMSQHGLRRLPVVTAEGSLYGIVSIDDLYSILAEELCELTAISAKQIITEKLEVS